MDDTSNYSTIQEHLWEYTQLGWFLTPISFGNKRPTHKAWQLQHNAINPFDDIDHIQGLGLLHAYSGTVAVDLDDCERAGQELKQNGIDLAALINAPDAVTICSGKLGHGKLLYKVPGGKALRSKKLQGYGIFDIAKHDYLDFRCASGTGGSMQDVLPPSIHPDTGKPYVWGGRGDWRNLPFMPPDLFKYWQSLLALKKSKRSPNAVRVYAAPDWLLHTVPPSGCKQGSVQEGAQSAHSQVWKDIQSALKHIPPDIEREKWILIGMGLQQEAHETDRTDDYAFNLWDDWSQGTYENPSSKYDCDAIGGDWDAFTPQPEGVGIGRGTIFHIAKEYGWTGSPAPTIDEVEVLFKDVQIAKVEKQLDPVSSLFGAKTATVTPDFSCLPKDLRDRAVLLGEGIGCDPLVTFFAGLGAACGAANAQMRLRLSTTYTVPPLLWFMTIGDPSDKKTPGTSPMLEPLTVMELESIPTYKSEMLLFKTAEAEYKNTLTEYTKHTTGLEALPNDAPRTTPEEPEEPVPLRLLVSDITSAKLVSDCATRPEGVLCYLDEMSGWVKKLISPLSSEDRAAWVQGYEGKTYRVGRINRGDTLVRHFAVSIFGNIQPAVIKKSITDMTDDGLLQRFIPISLRPEYTRDGVDVPEEELRASEIAWEQTLRTIHALPVTEYTLSVGAKTAFKDFHSWYYQQKTKYILTQASADFMGAFGKVAGQVARMCLVFHLLEDPHGMEVSEELALRVIKLGREFIIPSFKKLYLSEEGVSFLELWLAKHILIKANPLEVVTVTLYDLKKSGRCQLKHVGSSSEKELLIRDILGVLETNGWVSSIKPNSNRGKVAWGINPTIAITHEDFRNSLLKAR